MRKNNFSFIDINTSDIAYCANCAKVGMQNKLGELVYGQGERPQEDHDNWCMCYHCGKRYAIYERKQEGAFSYFKDTVSNPFDSTSDFRNIGKRKFKDRLNDYRDKDAM